MHFFTHRVFVRTVLALTIGCAAPGAIPPAAEGADGGTTAIIACQSLSAARCARFESCEPGTLKSRYGDRATCEARLGLACAAALAAPATADTPAFSSACATAIQAESCGDALSGVVPSACTTLAGGLDGGSPCGFSAQCQSAFCDVPDQQVCGTCTAPPAEGAPCASGTCVSPRVCTTDNVCLTPLTAVGATCDRTHPCGADLDCVRVRSGTTTTATCQKLASAAGADCSLQSLDHPNCDRRLGIACSPATHLCIEVPFAEAGEPCGALDGGVAACAGGATCQLDPQALHGHCVAPAADGQACGNADGGIGCLAPAVCVSGVCTLPDTTKCP